MRTHKLKCWPEPFQAILDGRKHHEVRHDDRGFAVGDVIELREWDPTPRAFPFGDFAGAETKRTLTVRVTYLSPGGTWGLPPRLCVMSIERVTP